MSVCISIIMVILIKNFCINLHIEIPCFIQIIETLIGSMALLQDILLIAYLWKKL